jgi:hypothetical protein
MVSADTDGYPADTDLGTDEYPVNDEFLSDALGSLYETWKGMKEGWWNRAGYETYLDYFLAEERQRAQMGLRTIWNKRRKRPPTQELPDIAPGTVDLEAVAADATRPRESRARQVNVKLTDLGYQALSEAARAYGVRPTTLARLLIHRGALAVLEAQGRSETNAA